MQHSEDQPTASAATHDDDPIFTSDERYRLMFERLVEYGFVVLDPSRTVRSWSAGAQRMFGYAPEQIIGSSVTCLYTPEDRAAGLPEHEFDHAVRHGEASDDCWQLRANGQRFFVFGITTAVYREDGSLRCFLRAFRDHTRQKLDEENLRSERNRLEFAQNASRMGTFEWDIRTNSEIWTDGMVKIYAIPSGEFVRTYDQWRDKVYSEDLRSCEKALAEAIAYHTSVETEFRIVLPDGSLRWIVLMGQAVYDDHGQPLRFVGVQVDINDRKLAEQALASANRELEMYASLASHDLQEPLRMVRSYLGLIQRNYAERLDARGTEYLQFALDGAERMSRLIRSLLDLANIERGGMRPELIEVQHAFAEAVDNLSTRINETGARLIQGELPTLVCDRSQLVRLFQNLIGNALKYCRGGVAPVVRVEAAKHGDQWTFSVRDNGIGIAEEHLERIFGMFQRLHSAGEFPGTGIGLAMCRKIVERHNGRIWAESRLGQGSTFWFTLPAKPADR